MRLWERGRLSVWTGRSSSNGPRRMAQPGCGCCSLGCAAWRFCGSRGSTRRRSQRSSWTRSDSAPPAGIYSTQRPRDPISDRRSVIVDASNHVHAESVARSCRARFAWSAAARRQRAGQAPGVVDKGTRHAAHLPGRGYRGDDVPHGRVPGAAGHRLSSSEPFVGCVARPQGSGGSGFRIAMARWQELRDGCRIHALVPEQARFLRGRLTYSVMRPR